jgi:guanylate kinase
MLVISSPSGAGKTTLANKLLASEQNLQLSISTTTRPPRPGEIDGKHYFFIDHPTFATRREAGEFLECAEVFENFYGTPKEPVETALGKGCDVLFDIDWQGARQIAETAPDDVVRVFVLPPSLEVLHGRLKTRATDDNEVIVKRMEGATREMSHWAEYDYVLVNDELEATLESLRIILAAERLRRTRHPELRDFVKTLTRGG